MAQVGLWSIRRDFPKCKTVWVYELETRRKVAELTGFTGKVEKATISKDGKMIALWEQGGPLRLWEVATKKELMKSDDLKDLQKLWFLDSEPGLAVLRCGLGIYNFKEGKGVDTDFPAEAVSSDGKMMATRGKYTDYGEDKTTRYPDGVHVYSRQQNKIIATFKVDSAWKSGPMLFTPDNRRLVVAGEGGVIRVWDVSKLKP